MDSDKDNKLSEWFNTYRQSREGDNLYLNLHRIAYFKLTSDTWKNHSKDFIYDSENKYWKLNMSTIDDTDPVYTSGYYVEQQSPFPGNNNTVKRFYFMAYINKNPIGSLNSLTISNFYIVNNTNNTSDFYFPLIANR